MTSPTARPDDQSDGKAGQPPRQNDLIGQASREDSAAPLAGWYREINCKKLLSPCYGQEDKDNGIYF